MDYARTNLVPIERLGKDLKEDQIPVTVDDQARQLIGFTKDQAASVGALLQHALAQLDGLAQTLVEHRHPCRVREVRIGGYQAQCDLRRWAPQCSAQGKAAMVRYRDQAR